MIKTDSVSTLVEKIEARTARVGIIGLGYVGLPLAVEQAKVGFHVTGFDLNAPRVEKLNAGENYISDVNDEEFRQLVGKGMIQATTDMSEMAGMDVLIICVPTPLDKNLMPDLSYIRSVTESIAQYLRPGQLISLESTTYPGTTEEVIQTRLEQNGLKAGEDFYLAYSPERVDPGNKRFSTKNTSKVVGGTDPESQRVAVTFYKQAIENIVPVSSTRIAEMVKVYENTFRAINIGFANEIALLCDRMGLNVWEVMDAAFTKPFGIMPFYPGPGVGGHCIPLDPHYLEWKAREYNFQTRFIALAGEVNRKMPEFVVDKAARVLNMDSKPLRGSRVLLLGMAYKGNLDDYRESPGITIYSLLQAASADVVFHDTWTPYVKEHGVDAHSVELSDEELKNADLIILITKHGDVDYERVTRLAKRILDTRNVIKSDHSNVTLL
ncbi:nucleotide sugar dehydrogenase [Deinococcus arenicola]|uniref:Nucleotide sugar dehydrogenase n=1 Tax=Deinococcus arenicola TaxID=2994950 RepID=A0ABU4DTI6_9DEIO|nr:nucleotide sugar dehydrogenase [Deinococcus sp. ZS9-10]MDV6375389.1 nucleotide sugar dehydrogenase [Deinococcus sp. ZS9-10]